MLSRFASAPNLLNASATADAASSTLSTIPVLNTSLYVFSSALASSSDAPRDAFNCFDAPWKSSAIFPAAAATPKTATSTARIDFAISANGSATLLKPSIELPIVLIVFETSSFPKKTNSTVLVLSAITYLILAN